MKGRKDGTSPLTINQGVVELGHELGNVLNGLLGMTRLVRDSGLNAEQEYWLKAIEQSGRQLRSLVESFLHERYQPGASFHLKPADLDGIELLEQALLAHAPAARDSASQLLLTVAPGVPRYWHCDPCMLRQVLDNLLGNALKFTRGGEVVLEAAVSADGDCPPGILRLAVVDSGPGIDAALGRRMFRAYERGPDQICDAAPGYGLGLFICRRIVHAMGGTIGWSSPAAGGARFEVTLPEVLSAVPERGALLPTRILRSVECCLDLRGTLAQSVASCLTRLGVPWRLPGQEATPLPAVGTDAASGGQPAGRLCISVAEMPVAAGGTGPTLSLRAETLAGDMTGSKCLQAPILECNLGPALLELALQWLWVRDGKPGSAPARRGPGPRDGRDSHQG